MSNENHLPDSEHDDEFLKVKELLLSMEPSIASRAKNRQVIAVELARFRESSTSVPWWRRSVSVPVPVAMGTCAALLGLMLFPFAGLDAASNESGTTVGLPTIDDQHSAKSINEPLAKHDFDIAQVDYEASETYLCGIGRIRYESLYHYKGTKE